VGTLQVFFCGVPDASPVDFPQRIGTLSACRRSHTRQFGYHCWPSKSNQRQAAADEQFFVAKGEPDQRVDGRQPFDLGHGQASAYRISYTPDGTNSQKATNNSRRLLIESIHLIM